MGVKHRTKYKEGDRINGVFTLIRNFCKPTAIKGKPQWLWECRCDCGNIFTAREHTLIDRFGCRSCTNKKTSTETALRKHKGITHIGLKNRLFKDYRCGARKRNMSFVLTFDEFVSLLEQDCAYCGQSPILHEYELQYMQKTVAPWAHNGIDRVDSSKGYSIDNCVPCCSKCNYAKHEMSIEEFKNWLTKIYKHLIEGSSTIPKGSTPQADGGGNGETPTRFIDYPQFNASRGV